MIKRAIRELQRERKAMERQEKTTIAEIKKNAKANQIVRNEFSLSLSLSSRFRTPSRIY